MSKRFMHHLAVLLLFSVLMMGQFTSMVYADPMTLNIPTSTLASRNFWQLNQAIALYQNLSRQSWPTLPEFPSLLKLGTRGYVILVLRERLRLTGDLASEDDIGSKRFDSQLSQAVKVFQARHGLKPDGVVGKTTRIELNIPPEIRMKQIAINMQRWADLADKMGDRFIIVNIPDFHMHLYDQNQKILTLKAIVGKPDLQTPELSSKVTRIIFNPYWNIPNKIARKDIAPKMLEDPGYLHRMHIRVFTSDDDNAVELSPRSVNWQAVAYEGRNYHLRQDPGIDNALGLVKFEFQNSHDVYMHDTSAKDLFNTEIRDYSHGCIRLENPFALAQYLLQEDSSWSDERIQDIINQGNTKYVKVPRPIPIFITYLTAWVDDEGRVNFRDDLYQMDGIYEPAVNFQTDEPPDSIYN